jgi:hypothetical protein
MLHLICYMTRDVTGSYWDFAQEAADQPPGDWLAAKIREQAGRRRIVLVSATPMTEGELHAIAAAQKYEQEYIASVLFRNEPRL